MEGISTKSDGVGVGVGVGVGGEKSPEVTLRKLDLSDVDDFMVWATDAKVARFCSWEPYTNKADCENYIREKAANHPWWRAICVENRAVGAISVTSNSGMDKCRAEVGYVLGFKWWGKGIATKAVKLAAKTIFEDWPHLERLEAFVDVENKASQRVLEKAGFGREGVLRKYLVLKGSTRDMVIFSLLSSEIQ